tara:strand:+ start:692 stop:1126 length:435 start_codon:yes stop_codon:yes gene_type:complete
MSNYSKSWDGGIFESCDETIQGGKSFSDIVFPGTVIGLGGGLGAGKTTFVKGLLEGLGYTGNVTSPTFTLVNQYNLDSTIYHIDCYRETDLESWIKLGINEYINSDSIVIIEWYGYIESILPIDMIKIDFKMLSQNSREIVIRK